MDMTPCMVAIYDGVQDLLDACIKDLKRTNKARRDHQAAADSMTNRFHGPCMQQQRAKPARTLISPPIIASHHIALGVMFSV